MMSVDSTTVDSVLDLCQHQHRRIVLGVLAEEQGALTFNDLTEAVLKYNHQTPLTEASEDVLVQIRLSLYHIHLPKLATEGLINYDADRQLVELIEPVEQVHETLSTVLDADTSLETPMAL